MRIAVSHSGTDAAMQARAMKLAESLGIPCVESASLLYDFHLVVTAQHVELRDCGDPRGRPILVDFLDRLGIAPRARVGGVRQPLGRALGLSRGRPSVIDATAGLGRDAFQMAAMGCRVTAIERSPVMAALLRDGIERARAAPKVERLIGDRLTLVSADAREVLASLAPEQRPEVVFLDPMFPLNAAASAAVKKEMRVLRALVGDDEDAVELFDAARGIAKRRVVVKRMRRTPPIAGSPDVIYRGKIARYDVYLMRASDPRHFDKTTSPAIKTSVPGSGTGA